MTFANYKTANNATGQLKFPISSSAGTLQLNTGQWGRFPSVYPYKLTITQKDPTITTKVIKRSIVEVSNRSWDIFTITWGAGSCPPDDDSNTPGTQAFSFDASSDVELLLTAEQVNDIQNEIVSINSNKLSKAEYQAGTYVYWASSTWNDDYVLTLPISPGAYAVGQTFRFMADVANSGPARLNINWLWFITIKKLHDQELENGDIEAWQIVMASYDGTYFQMNSQIATIAQASVWAITDSSYMLWEEISTSDVTNWYLCLFLETWPTFAQATGELNIWDISWNTRWDIPVISTGIYSSTFKLSARKNTSPSVNLTLRLETDDGTWKPSWLLVHANSIATIVPWSLTTTKADTTFTWNWAFTIPVEWTPLHLVPYQGTYWSETINATNYYVIWISTNDTTTRWISMWNWTVWWARTTTKWAYVYSTSFQNKLLSKTDSDFSYKSILYGISTESKAVWTYPKLVTQWLAILPSLTMWSAYYIWATPWSASTTQWANWWFIWFPQTTTKLNVFSLINGKYTDITALWISYSNTSAWSSTPVLMPIGWFARCSKSIYWILEMSFDNSTRITISWNWGGYEHWEECYVPIPSWVYLRCTKTTTSWGGGWASVMWIFYMKWF